MAEFGKRLDGPGGRRRADRTPLLLPAALHTVGCSRPVTLMNVSRTGAQLRMVQPLPPRQQVWLKVPPTEIFGTVRWTKGDRCGIAFDDPISADELCLLRKKGKFVLVHGLAPEEQMAIEDWKTGLAR